MAGGYIKLDKDLSEDPRLLDLADVVAGAFNVEIVPGNELSDGDTEFTSRDARDMWCDALLGALSRLWKYADVHVRSDDSLPLGVTALSQVMRLPSWIIRLYPPEWLEIMEDEDIVRLPGYCEKNNIIPRDTRRSTGKERTRKWRENLRNKRSHTVTQKRDGKRDAVPVTPPSHTRHGDATPVPVPVPGPIDQDRYLGNGQEAPLASAQGRLAGRQSEPERSRAPPAKSTAELEADAHKLARAGMSSHDIARTLQQFGVTIAQVIAWLANSPLSAS